MRDHQWLGYISGCFPFMNCFQALASMLYLSAAVECDDAGCKDVGATRNYTVELDERTWSPLSLPDKKSRSKMLWPCLIHFWSTIYLSTLSAAYWDFPKFSISFIPFFNGIYVWDHSTSRCGITIAPSWKRQRQASKLFIWRSFAWWNIIPSIFHVSKKRKPRFFPCKRPCFFWWWIHSYLHSYFGGWGKHGKVHMEKPSLGISAWCQSTCVKVATFIQALHLGCHHQNLNRPCLSIIFARFFVMEKLQLMICLWRSFQEKSLQS